MGSLLTTAYASSENRRLKWQALANELHARMRIRDPVLPMIFVNDAGWIRRHLLLPRMASSFVFNESTSMANVTSNDRCGLVARVFRPSMVLCSAAYKLVEFRTGSRNYR